MTKNVRKFINAWDAAKGNESERRERGTLKRAVFNEPDFREDAFGNRNKSTIEIFLAKAVV